MAVAPFGVVMANLTAPQPGGVPLGGLDPPQTAEVLKLVARGSDPMWEPDNQPRRNHYTGENLV